MARIEGIFTPPVVPLDNRGNINESEFRRYIEWLIEQGTHGLYPNGSSGEFTRYTADERRRIAEITIDQVSGRVPVLAGAAEANVRETLAACETYCGYGATAVAIVAPYYYRLGPESVYAYFREIARHAPIDITLYNIPMFASPIDVVTVRRLAELERIVGIKDSSGDIAAMLQMLRTIRPVRPDFVFLNGWETALVPMLLMGCDGGTNALSGVVPDLLRRVFDVTRTGDVAAACQLQTQVSSLFEAIVDPIEFPIGLRLAVATRGFQIGDSRQPLSEKQQADLPGITDNIRQRLVELGYEHLAERS